MTRSIKNSDRCLVWARAAGRCILCGADVTSELLSGTDGNYAQLAHICADAPGGPRYDPNQTEKDRNSASNLMLLCHRCHKLVDDNPKDYEVDFLRERKASFEGAVAKAAESLCPTTADVVTVAMPIVTKEMRVDEAEWRTALVQSHYILGGAGPFEICLQDLNFSVALEQLKRGICTYRYIHSRGRRTAVFALAPQPILIALGSMLSDDDTVDIFQKHRGGSGWTWIEEGEGNDFLLERIDGAQCEEAVLVLSLSGEVNPATYAGCAPDAPRYILRARRQGTDSILSKNDLCRFREAATSALFQIHEQNPMVRRVNLMPAMPVSACVTLGMVWNANLIPELNIYEKTGGEFAPAVKIGGPDGFSVEL